jgi:hypothetical protein
MFDNLANFEFKRSKVQALVFYLVYGVLSFVTIFILAACLALLFPISQESASSFGFGVGAIVACIICITLSFIILKKKEKMTNFSSIIYLILTLVLSLAGGVILGMILPAFLSTQEKTSVGSNVQS